MSGARGIIWVLAFVAVACGAGGRSEVTPDAMVGKPDAGVELGAADGSVDASPGGWTFVPSNVPLEALREESSVDLVLGAPECGDTAEIEIDTDASTITGCGIAVGGS